MHEEPSYDIQQLKKLLGVGRSTLRSWVEHGFIQPSVRASTCTSKKNLFSVCDLYRAVLFKELVQKASLHRKVAATIVWRLTDRDWRDEDYAMITLSDISLITLNICRVRRRVHTELNIIA